MRRTIPEFMPEPSIKYMDFDVDELIGAAYNWCEKGSQGLEEDARKHPEERVEMLNMASDLRAMKRKLAETVSIMYPGWLRELADSEEERKIRECMAL